MNNSNEKTKENSKWCKGIEKILSILLDIGPKNKDISEAKDILKEISNSKQIYSKEQNKNSEDLILLKQEYKKLNDEYINVKRQAKELEQKKEEQNKQILNQADELSNVIKNNKQLQNNLTDAEAKIEQLKTNVLKDSQPAKLERELAGLTSPLREIALKYFDLENVHVFLIQCGQFSRITQCWEACIRWMNENEQSYEDMNNFLCLIGSLYNKGSAQAEAKIVTSEINEHYDYEKHQRIGKDGYRIREALLPGLENAAGKIVHKPLVTLL